MVPELGLDSATAAADLLASLEGTRKRKPASVGGRDIAALAHDMQALDTDIASLEATLHSSGLAG